MAALLENIWQIITMALLLLCSGFLSGSETAFFNISNRQLLSFKGNPGKMHQIAARLLNDPKKLLTSLLLGNMAVNVMFFSLASVFSVKLGTRYGPAGATAAGLGMFMALLIFGEILPKSLAYSKSGKFCLTAGPLCFLCMRLLSPVVRIFDLLIVVPAVRLFTPVSSASRVAGSVTADQFKLLIDSSRQTGQISLSQNQILSEVVELSFLKVRHIMKPRVDMVACQISDPLEKIQATMLENGFTILPVFTEDIDDIVGLIEHRDILLNPSADIKNLIKDANFIPEQKTVESLLEFFRTGQIDYAIVVDEYGGIAGEISLEDIVEELIGPIEPAAEAEPVTQIGPLQYRLQGSMAIHDWAELFGIDPGHSPYTTIGGLMTALVGRIPKQGDIAHLKNVKLTVEKVKRHRIETMTLSFEALE